VNLDTILLSSWVKIHSHDSRFIEAGCASGAISLILAMKFNVHVTGIDIQGDLIELARQNAEMNSITNAEFIHGDLRDKNIFPRESFDALIINPPYESLSRGRLSSNSSRSTARLELSCTIDDVGDFAFRVLRSKGRMFSVFSSERLDVFINAMTSHRIIPKRIRLVYPKIHYNSGIFLSECVKNAGEGLNILPPLIVRDDDNNYTQELLKFYEL
jgi:tRNA1(Val) A37 N6-methylase TrmN6